MSNLQPFPGTAEPEKAKGPRGLGVQISFNSRATLDPQSNSVIVQQAKRAGLSWLCVKSGNELETAHWLAYGKDLITRCENEGIDLYTWHFSYPDGWERQTEQIARVLALGSCGHLIDAEEAWEYAPAGDPKRFSHVRLNDQARAFMAKVRSMVGEDAFIAHEPIWSPPSHPGFPYAEFGERCDAVFPQAYWTAAGQDVPSFCSRVDDVWRTFMATHARQPPVWPVGITYGAGDGWDHFAGRLLTEDVIAFRHRYADRPVLFFSWEAASPRFWAALNDAADRMPDTEPAPPGDGAA